MLHHLSLQLLSGIDVSDAVEVNNPEANFPTSTLAGKPGKKNAAVILLSCCSAAASCQYQRARLVKTTDRCADRPGLPEAHTVTLAGVSHPRSGSHDQKG